MINVKTLEDALFNNPDNIIKVLVAIGFKEDTIVYHDTRNKQFISAVRPGDETADNRMGFLMYTDRCFYKYTTRNGQGNIFTLVMDIKHVNFVKSLDIISSILGITKQESLKKVTYPFQSFYKLLVANQNYPELEVKTYSEDVLPPRDSLSYKYLKDGVSLIVQEKRGVRYDHERDAIITPIYSFEGRLIGAKARSNNPNVAHDKRFYAYLPYSKTLTLYGYNWNYSYIQKKQLVIIVEAEKSVLQAESFGCNICLAVGGHSISDVQARYIKNLNVRNIIVAFDEGVAEDEIIYECNKLANKSDYYHSDVHYIYDAGWRYLEKGKKQSPTDLGKNIFEKIIKECKKGI